MEPYTGADSVVILHSNGQVWPDPNLEYQPQPLVVRATGVRGSTTRAPFLGIRIADGGIHGIRITWASPACGTGLAGLVAVDADDVAFSAPGDPLGDAVQILEGETKMVPSGTSGGSAGVEEGRYVIVERTDSADLIGATTMKFLDIFNGVLVGSDILASEVPDGGQTGQVLAPLDVGDQATVDAILASYLGGSIGTSTGFRVPFASIDKALQNFRVRFLSGTYDGTEVGVKMNVDLAQIGQTGTYILFDTELHPDPAVSDDFTLWQYAGRLHAIFMHNLSDADVTNLRVWQPPLGTEQSLVWGYPTNGLPATGAGSIVVPDITDWHPNVRFVRIMESDGITERELVGGHLVGNVFIVPELGRGLHGTTPQATADGDILQPVSGLQIGFDVAGIKPFPTTIQHGSLAIVGIQAYFPEQVYYDANRLPLLPTLDGQGWNRGTEIGQALGYAGPITPDERVALWVHLIAFPGEKCTPITPVGLAWQYDAGGKTYRQIGWTNYRIANDLSNQRYRAYRSVDSVPTADPVAVGADRPLTGIPLVDDAINALELRKVNDYGMEGEVGQTTIRLVGGVEATPPQPPASLACRQDGANGIAISGFYTAVLDPNPADKWIVEVYDWPTAIGPTGAPPTITQELDVTGGLAELQLALTDAGWVPGVTVSVDVWMRRSTAPVEFRDSPTLQKEVDLADVTLAVPADPGVFHGEAKLEE